MGGRYHFCIPQVELDSRFTRGPFKEIFVYCKVIKIFPRDASRGFVVLSFTFRSLIHMKPIFVYLVYTLKKFFPI